MVTLRMACKDLGSKPKGCTVNPSEDTFADRVPRLQTQHIGILRLFETIVMCNFMMVYIRGQILEKNILEKMYMRKSSK